MDMPPPQNITPVEQIQIIKYDSTWDDEDEFIYFLSSIDATYIPQNIKQFAKNNDCRYLEKEDYTTRKIFENNGGVYSCIKNHKVKYIFDYGQEKKLRFDRRWESYKLRHRSVFYRILYLLFGL